MDQCRYLHQTHTSPLSTNPSIQFLYSNPCDRVDLIERNVRHKMKNGNSTGTTEMRQPCFHTRASFRILCLYQGCHTIRYLLEYRRSTTAMCTSPQRSMHSFRTMTTVASTLVQSLLHPFVAFRSEATPLLFKRLENAMMAFMIHLNHMKVIIFQRLTADHIENTISEANLAHLLLLLTRTRRIVF